jgi:hypothetical protein
VTWKTVSICVRKGNKDFYLLKIFVRRLAYLLVPPMLEEGPSRFEGRWPMEICDSTESPILTCSLRNKVIITLEAAKSGGG